MAPMACLDSSRVQFDLQALSVEEIAPAPHNKPLRKSRGRLPTPHVSSELLAGIGVRPGTERLPFGCAVSFSDEVITEAMACPVAVRSVLRRVPTPFVPLATLEEVARGARPHVQMSEALSVEEMEMPGSVLMRASRGRIPTPFATAEMLQMVQVSEAPSVEEMEMPGSVLMRASRGRIPTPFATAEMTQLAAGGVQLSEALSVEEMEMPGSVLMRASRGRIPTPFVTAEMMQTAAGGEGAGGEASIGCALGE